MANINELLARAAALRDETQLNSINPERAGGIMYETLLALNELWLQQGAALVISKIYASVAAMEADTSPVSDLTGKPIRPGMVVVIASSDSDNGSVYRYNGTSSPRWSLVGEIGNLEPVDSLDSDSTSLPLAAHQGKVLDGKISQLGQVINGETIEKTSAINIENERVNAAYNAILQQTGYARSAPIAVTKGLTITVYTSTDNYTAVVAKCNADSTGIQTLLAGDNEGLHNYVYECDFDGYVIISGHITPAYHKCWFSYPGLKQKVQALEGDINDINGDIDDINKESAQPKRQYPNALLPCISFQFDDNPDNDDLVVALFDELGVKCNFAFIASDANITAKGQKYLQWNKMGYGICSHSVDGLQFNTTNYTRETALVALQASKNKLEKLGIVVNGFVSPDSTMDSSFIDLVQDTYSYAFTINDGKSGERTGNPCRNVRESMEAQTLSYVKSRIDNALYWGYNITLYGHAANFGNSYSGETWDIAKLRSIVEYAITKRNTGIAFIGNTDECMEYFYAGTPYNVNLSGEIGQILPKQNHRYYINNLIDGTIQYDINKGGDCEMFIKTASNFSGLVFGSGFKFNSVPVIDASETWHLKIMQGCIIATKLS